MSRFSHLLHHTRSSTQEPSTGRRVGRVARRLGDFNAGSLVDISPKNLGHAPFHAPLGAQRRVTYLEDEPHFCVFQSKGLIPFVVLSKDCSILYPPVSITDDGAFATLLSYFLPLKSHFLQSELAHLSETFLVPEEERTLIDTELDRVFSFDGSKTSLFLDLFCHQVTPTTRLVFLSKNST